MLIEITLNVTGNLLNLIFTPHEIECTYDICKFSGDTGYERSEFAQDPVECPAKSVTNFDIKNPEILP